MTVCIILLRIFSSDMLISEGKVSTCELEADVLAADIMNREEIDQCECYNINSCTHPSMYLSYMYSIRWFSWTASYMGGGGREEGVTRIRHTPVSAHLTWLTSETGKYKKLQFFSNRSSM